MKRSILDHIDNIEWMTPKEYAQAHGLTNAQAAADLRGCPRRARTSEGKAKFWEYQVSTGTKPLKRLGMTTGPYHVEIVSYTSEATWQVLVRDRDGHDCRHINNRGKLMHSDEGCSHNHYWMAEQEANEIRERLRQRGLLDPEIINY